MLVRHDDKHEEDPFRRSSYEWKEVNIRFYDKGIRIFTDGTFVVEELLLDYIKIPQYIHNAESFLPAGKYKLPNGKLLEGKVDCELPEITHKEIVGDQKELYKDFADQWLDDTTQRDGIQEENRMVHRILDACEVLQLQGGALWIEGKIVAMTLGSPINHNTFDVHVEKANPAIEGAYTVINNEFAKQIPEQYIYINREEDLGIPGLRFAKESYQPELRLYKGTALLRRHAQV